MTLQMNYQEKYEQGIEKGVEQEKIDSAMRMIEDGVLPLEKVAMYPFLDILSKSSMNAKRAATNLTV